MKTKSPVIVNGQSFDTATAAARFYNIPSNVITQAIKNKCISTEQAINDYFERKKAKEVTAFGKTFASHREACRFYNLEATSIRSRIKKKEETLEQAITYFQTKRPVVFTAFGQEFSSVMAMAAYFEVSPMALSNRIKDDGLSTEDAINIIKTNQVKNQVTIDGKTYDSLSDVAREKGMKVGTLFSRIHAQGMDVESALNKPLSRERADNISKLGYYGVVYQITNAVNGKQYIGHTTNIEKRKAHHFGADYNKSEKPLYVAMRKDGIENFSFEVLERFKSQKAMLDEEERLIGSLNTLHPNGYNLTSGGETGHHRTAVTINGEFYSSAREACLANKLSYESTQQYKRKHELNWQEAIMAKLDQRIVIDGRVFNSVNGVCKHYKISYETIHKLMTEGLTIEEAVKQPRYLKTVTINGFTYRSIAATCKALGVNEPAARSRIREKGETPEQAIQYLLDKPEQIGYLVLGRRFDRVKDVCEAFKISFDTLSKRRNEGMSLDEAVSVKNRIESVVVDNVRYRSVAEVCRKLNLSPPKVSAYKQKHDCTSNEAVQAVLADERKPDAVYVILGKEYKSKAEICDEFGLNIRLLNQRIFDGMSIEEAAITPVRVSTVVVEGAEYKTKSAAYNAFGIDKRVHYKLNAKVRNGMTVEAAVKDHLKKKGAR
ncbi:GIY-YIG nuclease family protein [Vibrio breoganii]